MQSACSVLYCHLWPVWLYRICLHYLVNGTVFGKRLLGIKCVFWFSLDLLSEKFLILRRILLYFNETWLFWQIFEKSSDIQFHENPSGGAELFHADRRVEGRTDMTKLIVAFHNCANAPKKYVMESDLEEASRVDYGCGQLAQGGQQRDKVDCELVSPPALFSLRYGFESRWRSSYKCLDSALKHTVTRRLPSTRFPKHAFSLSTLYNLRIWESVK